jgi:hypothetical protein
MILDLSNPVDKNKFTTYSTKLLAHRKVVELKECRPPRSTNQNAYLHVVVSLWGLEYGYTLTEAKQLLKQLFGLKYTHESGHEFPKSTADYTTAEMSHFIEQIRHTAGKDGCYIPTAEEYLIHYHKINQQVKSIYL